MAQFGGRAIPSIGFSIGNSHQDLKAVTDDLKQLRAVLQSLKDDAKGTTDALNALGKTRTAPRTAPAPKNADDQEYERVVARRRQATRAEAVRRANDPVERQYAAHTAAQRQQRMQQAVAPRTDTERRYQEIVARDREKAMEETVKRGTTNPEAGALGRLTNFAGWSPFMPGGNMMYLMQMALGDMGLGLPMAGVAAGMGAVGLGAGALGLNAALVNQNRTGEQVAAQVGTTPAFVTGGEVSKQLAQLGGQFHLTGDQPGQLAAGLAAGGLDRAQSMGDAFAQAGNLVNVFGMSVQDATKLVSTQYTDLGRSTQQVTSLLQGMAQAALSTGLPATNIAAVLAGSPDLLANVGADQAARSAAAFAGVYGSAPTATTMANIANVHGVGAASLAAQLGMSLPQLDQLRGTDAGQGQMIDRLDALARSTAAQAGPEIGFSAFNARMAGSGQSLTWDEYLKAIGAAPDAGATASARPVTLGPPVPQSAQAALEATAAGNLAAGASAAQPWNVKDMTVNAAQVALDVTGNVLQGTGAALSPGTSAATLSQIAGQGGPQGFAANARLATQGNIPAIQRALDQMVTGVLPTIASLVGGPSAGAAARAAISGVQAAANGARGATGNAPGGGGDLGTVTINLTQNGQRVASIPVAIQNGQASQQFQQYVRGQQYP